MRRFHSKSLIAGATIGAMALVGSGGAVFAQESPSPEASPAAAESPEQQGAAAGHPLHIHAGTCQELGDIIFPLGQVSSDLMIHGEAASGEQVGATSAEGGVKLNLTIVDATISELTEAEHAINVHQSEEDLATYIACGEIGGTLIDGSQLTFPLKTQNDSGFLGVAWLSENDDETTNVYSFLLETDAMSGAAAQPSAPPAAEESPAVEASPMAEESPMAEASPMAEESPMAEASPMVDESPALEEDPLAEESPAAEGDADVTITIDVDASEEPEVEVSE